MEYRSPHIRMRDVARIYNALENSGKDLPLQVVTVAIDGRILGE